MHPTPRYSRAIDALTDLLGRLRIDFIFVGSVARAAWLGGDVSSGSIDLIALMKEQQRQQVAMMGSNRGFRVEREEIEAAEELDLIPLHFVDPDGEVRVHVLLASNALYGRMVAAGREIPCNDRTIRVVTPEGLALLSALGEQQRDVEKLIRLPEFDRHGYNDTVRAIGLAELVVPE